MTKEELERLEKDHKFYESISEFEPEQVTKQIKDYYEQRSKLFKSHKDMDKQDFRYGCVVTLLMLLVAIAVAFIIAMSYSS